MSLPDRIAPMLAETGTPFDSAEHLFEPKWDGIRCIIFGGDSIRLQSRSQREISEAFPELTESPFIEERGRWILDGEIVCLAENGMPSFDAVRNRLLLRHPARVRRARAETPAHFVAFDLLAIGGTSLMPAPLAERRERLQHHFRPGGHGILCPGITGNGQALFDRLTAQGWEGIVAKALTSPYLPGRRSSYWVKMRHQETARFSIVGYVPRGVEDIASLAVAREVAGGLQYVGHVGSGLSGALGMRLREALVPVDDPPRLQNLPAGGQLRTTVWVAPRLACRVRFLEYTRDGYLRQPVLLGLEDDVSPSTGDDDVRRRTPETR